MPCSRKSICRQVCFDVYKLKNEEPRKQFCIALHNRFETLAEESGTVNEGSPQSE